MKKILTLALAALMLVAVFAGCGKKSSKVKAIEIDLTKEFYAFGIDKDQPELLEAANAFIAKIIDDGTLETICNKYYGEGTPEAVKSAAYDESKDQLVVATNAAFEPMEYMIGEDYYGIDIEIAALLAKELNMELVINNMDFDAVCLSVGQHKSDVAMAGLTIKEDRKEYVNFTDSYYEASQRIVVMEDNTIFDACKTTEDIEAILKSYDSATKVGVQTGTTGQFYTEGDESWGFDGYNVTCVGYKNGSLAVQDLINGNLNFVIIDCDPAAALVKAFNALN